VLVKQTQQKQFGVTTKLTMMQYSNPYSFEKTDVRWEKLK